VLRAVTAIVTFSALFAVFTSNYAKPDEFPTTDHFEAAASVLINRCYECHNPTERSGGLDLSTRDGLGQGGDNGPVITPGHSDESYLIERVANGEMPPKKAGKSRNLTPDELATLQSWIDSGALWPTGRTLDPFQTTTDTRAGLDFWSLQPVRATPAPQNQR
jgi:uncharacterized membrane protein